MASALVVFAPGSEDMEATCVASILDRGGVKVVRAAISNDGSKEIELAHGMRIICDKHIDECQEDYDLIVIPGGLNGAKNCAQCETLIAKLKAQKLKQRYIGAICAAPGMVLEAHHLIGEAKATGYPGCADNIKNYQDVSACIDEEAKIITGKGPSLSIHFALACLSVLVDEATLQKVKQGMLCYH